MRICPRSFVSRVNHATAQNLIIKTLMTGTDRKTNVCRNIYINQFKIEIESRNQERLKRNALSEMVARNAKFELCVI